MSKETATPVADMAYIQAEQEESVLTKAQRDELTKLEYEYQRFSLAAAILEQKLRVKQLTELLNQKTTDQEKPKVKRQPEEY